MKKTTAVLGSALFFFIAPGGVAGLVPWWITGWRWSPPFLSLGAARIVGAALIVIGCAGLIESFARFALEGRGMSAPIAPPGQLVVGGLYRHVRNPMYVFVLAAILGQAILLADWRLLAYGGFIWIAFTLFVMGYEKPVLRATFGAQYESYCANVSRWLPRMTPWKSE